jgi:hypothetical protein
MHRAVKRARACLVGLLQPCKQQRLCSPRLSNLRVAIRNHAKVMLTPQPCSPSCCLRSKADDLCRGSPHAACSNGTGTSPRAGRARQATHNSNDECSQLQCSACLQVAAAVAAAEEQLPEQDLSFMSCVGNKMRYCQRHTCCVQSSAFSCRMCHDK